MRRIDLLPVRFFVGGLLMLPCDLAVAQDTSGPLSFEVASVKVGQRVGDPGSPNYARGGPGTSDPERIDYHNIRFREFLLRAFPTTPESQLVTPEWMYTERYDLIAKVPPGTTKRQANEMILNLLKERFHLKLHHEMREANGYEFTIAKGGSKLKESAYPDAVPATAAQIGYVENDFPQVEPGYAGMIAKTYNGQLFVAARSQPARLICALALWGFGESATRTPVADKTGLTGTFDVNVKFGVPSKDGDPPGGPSVVEIFEKQLGLHVERKRVTIDVVMVDSADKVPTEN